MKKLNKRIGFIGSKYKNNPPKFYFYDKKTGKEVIFKDDYAYIKTKIKKLI